MKHLFLVTDDAKDSSKIYAIEANNPSEAEEIIVNKFMPYFDMTYDEMVSGLSDMEINIEHVEGDIIEL